MFRAAVRRVRFAKQLRLSHDARINTKDKVWRQNITSQLLFPIEIFPNYSK
jgi:hypothetical protein